MLNKIKYILLLLMFGQIAYSQVFAEDAMLDYKRSSAYINNYHGPVKSAYYYYTYVIDPVPFAVSQSKTIQSYARHSIMLQNRKALGSGIYNEFDQEGRLKKHVISNLNGSYFGKSDFNYRTASTYIYNETDWAEKSKIKLKKRQIYPVNDYDILVKPNTEKPYDHGYGSDTLKYKYDYIIDQNGRILKEINYGRAALPFTETEYIYDNHNNVKQLNIRTKQKDPIPFFFLDTETGFCPDLHIAYEYDFKDRMSQVTYYGCKDTLAFEKYAYHPEKDYVKERTRYIKSSMRGVEHVTPTMIFYHNENGDIIEKKFVRSYPNQYLGASSIVLRESIYYKYEYDKYNNWVKCYIYMEGRPEESEPTAIAQRDLEYYDS
ncbi:hypothetical protein SAMN05421741_1257 [Paenimyroides ummariense]|uniref:YD repeat-containing protein n=1 Tax=Paenimyroides ummariense TaxID=913024 RepID=A0A1I5F676_9FLAO|nr:hypothetical protein [Paenimyroides ummariense]SFO19129.1 hypothetical protein SAMN05421741_1257 [Paenimyroides ummariense]